VSIESWRPPDDVIREEPYQADIIKRFGIKAVIGKGGMGAKTQKACQDHGCVYLHAIGGAAQIYARCVQRVLSVRLEQFGSTRRGWTGHDCESFGVGQDAGVQCISDDSPAAGLCDFWDGRGLKPATTFQSQT